MRQKYSIALFIILLNCAHGIIQPEKNEFGGNTEEFLFHSNKNSILTSKYVYYDSKNSVTMAKYFFSREIASKYMISELRDHYEEEDDDSDPLIFHEIIFTNEFHEITGISKVKQYIYNGRVGKTEYYNNEKIAHREASDNPGNRFPYIPISLYSDQIDARNVRKLLNSNIKHNEYTSEFKKIDIGKSFVGIQNSISEIDEKEKKVISDFSSVINPDRRYRTSDPEYTKKVKIKEVNNTYWVYIRDRDLHIVTDPERHRLIHYLILHQDNHSYIIFAESEVFPEPESVRGASAS